MHLYVVIGAVIGFIALILIRILLTNLELRAVSGFWTNTFLNQLNKEIQSIANDDLLSLRINYFALGYDACYSKRKNIISISPKWIVDHARKHVDSIQQHKIFYFTICHELGHKTYGDDLLFTDFNKTNTLISILREFRADNYAKQKCGYSNDEAYSVLEEKIHHCRFNPTKNQFDHPTWNDRKNFIGKFTTYSSELESEAKAIYGQKLNIKADNIKITSLLSEESTNRID